MPRFAARYECKYLIDASIVPELRRFISPFAKHDKFAERAKDHSYWVSSLYLDSADLHLYNQTVAGECERYKLRVRTYSDDPASPVFFEVKQKFNAIVAKRRAGVTREQAQAILRQEPLPFVATLSDADRRDLLFFNHCVAMSQARPITRVKYLREAFEARDHEPVRITLDTDLMHAATIDDTLSHRDGPWTATPTGGVVLEIKYTDRLPSWAHEIVQVFAVNQRAVPKYVLSVNHMLRGGRKEAMNVGGMTLPPMGG